MLVVWRLIGLTTRHLWRRSSSYLHKSQQNVSINPASIGGKTTFNNVPFVVTIFDDWPVLWSGNLDDRFYWQNMPLDPSATGGVVLVTSHLESTGLFEILCFRAQGGEVITVHFS